MTGSYEDRTDDALTKRWRDAAEAAEEARLYANRCFVERISGARLDIDPVSLDAIKLMAERNPDIPAFIDRNYVRLRDLPKPRAERRRFIKLAAATAVSTGVIGYIAGALVAAWL